MPTTPANASARNPSNHKVCSGIRDAQPRQIQADLRQTSTARRQGLPPLSGGRSIERTFSVRDLPQNQGRPRQQANGTQFASLNGSRNRNQGKFPCRSQPTDTCPAAASAPGLILFTLLLISTNAPAGGSSQPHATIIQAAEAYLKMQTADRPERITLKLLPLDHRTQTQPLRDPFAELLPARRTQPGPNHGRHQM